MVCLSDDGFGGTPSPPGEPATSVQSWTTWSAVDDTACAINKESGVWHEETRHRRVSEQGEVDRPVPGRRLRGHGLRRPHPRPHRAEEPPARAEERLARQVLRRRRERVRALLRGVRSEEED